MPENIGDPSQSPAGSSGSSGSDPTQAQASGSTGSPDPGPGPAQAEQQVGAAGPSTGPAESPAGEAGSSAPGPAESSTGEAARSDPGPAQQRAGDNAPKAPGGEQAQQRAGDDAPKTPGGGEATQATPAQGRAGGESQKTRAADKGEGPKSTTKRVDLSQAQLAFQIAGGTVDDFLVSRFRGTEGVCQLYRFEIELVSSLGQVTFDDMVGKPAVLSVNTPFGERWFHGLISRFEMTDETAALGYYRAELVPSLWLLTHRYNSRIFQNQMIPDIVSDVLIKAGIASDRFRVDLLTRSYQPPREYCVQYRETDYHFVCRLMEEEGIRWYFEQNQEGHVLVLDDGPASSYSPIEGEPGLRYCPPTGLNVQDEHVYRFRLGQMIRPGAVVLNDYNFENPKLSLQTSSDCGRDAGLEFSDYPGEYIEQSPGQELATLRAEEFETSRILGSGQSNSPRLTPGRTFELGDHPSELDGSYMVTSVTHRGKQATTRTTTTEQAYGGMLDVRLRQAIIMARSHENQSIRDLAEALLQISGRFKAGDPTARRSLTQWLYHAGQVSRDVGSAAGASGANPLEAMAIPNLLEDIAQLDVVEHDAPVYECRFECIPAATSYRPPRATPWPVMRGTQTARVVGPSGEEIYTDEYGRVKVQFNWDREGKFDENSSCWIRVSQGSAGGQYGIMFIPRIGQEVIVDFLEGDPDKPIITGRVYNADHMPPYALPDEKTKSVIKTRSSKEGGGSHELRFEDLKDSEQMLIYGKKDLHIRFENDRVENIENDRHLTVGNNRFEKVQKNYHLKVDEEDYNVEIGRDKTLKVSGKVSEKITGTASFDVGGDVVEKFGSNHKHEVTMTYACKAMSIKLEASTGIELKCGGSSIVLTPAAIFIVGGPLVNINSGSGPPVGPVTAMATAPVVPEPPGDADTVEHGTDTRYDGGEELAPGEIEVDIAGHEFEEPEEREQEETTYVDLLLVDEDGDPIPGEKYRVVDSKGKVKEGSLDANGRAHVTGISPGNCDITYPNMDMSAWKRT
ncbi:MAG: type VI secretion system tip protein VgrG [Phycisphaerae bacterium]|nr:type VI secretion system tip protein VgrG [Phycisphaerae bacterium]